MRSRNGMLPHQTPAPSSREEPPAWEKFCASSGWSAVQNNPLERMILLENSFCKKFINRLGWNGRLLRKTMELIPYSSVSGLWILMLKQQISTS